MPSSTGPRHDALRHAVQACRRVGLSDNTLTALGRALFPQPSAQWTPGQQAFVTLWLLLASMACDLDPVARTVFEDLAPVLRADPPEGIAQWAAHCFDRLRFFLPEEMEALRQALSRQLSVKP